MMTPEQLALLTGPDARMDAYYYGFEPTGNPHIDMLLSAVAHAGKGCHRTEDWSIPAEMDYGPLLKGQSYEELIQEVANHAAKELEAGGSVGPERNSVDDSSELSGLDLKAIEQRAGNATQGPWEATGSVAKGGKVFEPDGYQLPGCFGCGENDAIYEFEDAEFIAHARQDIPALIARIRELETSGANQLDQERSEVQKFINQRPEYITAMKNTRGTDDQGDYFRWSGHAEARRQLAQTRGWTVPHEIGDTTEPKETL